MAYATETPDGSRTRAAADHSRPSQASLGIPASATSHAPRTQWPILRFPVVHVDESRPGDQPGGSSLGARRRRFRFPDFVRAVLPSGIERQGGFLSGQPNDMEMDPEGRGTVRGVRQEGVGMHEAHDTLFSVDFTPDALPTFGEAGANFAPDQTEHVQSPCSNEHDALISVRASYPGIQVAPVPQSRMIVLAAASTPVELQLPDGCVMFRITWSGMFAGQDLIISMTGGALATFAAASNLAPASLDGLILNPDPGSYYLAKGKRSLSAMVPVGVAAFINPTLVNVQAYLNN